MRKLLILISIIGHTASAQPDIEEGKQLFTLRCAACHGIDMKVVGPALQGISERRESGWIVDFVRSSQTMVQANDPQAVEIFNQFNGIIMPDHMDLSEDQVNNIVAYIEQEGQKPAVASASGSAMPAVVPPYKNKKSIVDKIVYLNFDEEIMPLKKSDTLSWTVILLFVAWLVMLLCIMVHVSELLRKIALKKKDL